MADGHHDCRATDGSQQHFSAHANAAQAMSKDAHKSLLCQRRYQCVNLAGFPNIWMLLDSPYIVYKDRV